MGQTLDCFRKGIVFTQSHRPEKAFPDSYDKCEPSFTIKLLNLVNSAAMLHLGIFPIKFKTIKLTRPNG